MRRCVRCDRWHRADTSPVCENCWVEMGQMAFEDDEDLHFWKDDEDEDPAIASIFDEPQDRL